MTNTWYFNRLAIPSEAKLLTEGRYLEIGEVKWNHAGDYYCYTIGPDSDGLVSRAVLVVVSMFYSLILASNYKFNMSFFALQFIN